MKRRIKLWLYKVITRLKVYYFAIIELGIKNGLKQCGKNVSIGPHAHIVGRVSVGDRVRLGYGVHILSTRADVTIGSDVMFGPNVMIVTGDHRTDIIGRTMMSIKDDEKLPENDADVVIENDVWVGAGVTILKGVTVGEGSVIASGAVVTKSIPPYSIAGGVPARVLKSRFSEDEIKEHIQIIKDKKGDIS